MKNLFIALIALLSINLYSQQTEQITLNEDQVWFGFSSGVVAKGEMNDWDVAFQNAKFDAGVLLNAAAGLKLYHVENLSPSDWDDNIDPNDKVNWTQYYNSIQSWKVGAFNMGKDGFGEDAGNYGWGSYNSTTHNVHGNSIFVIEFPDGSFKKFMIIMRKTGANFNFKYADLDGSNEVEKEIKASDYTNKNYIYYSIQDEQVIDREPNTADWDLTFTKYSAPIETQTGVMYYGVLGIKNNMNVQVAELNDVTFESAEEPLDTEFSTSITEIGYDWKELESMDPVSYKVVANRVYFVKDPVAKVHKVQFTAFGAEDNTVEFKMETISSVNDYKNGEGFIVYPNVVDKNSSINVVFDFKSNINSGKLVITDMLGNWQYERKVNGLSSFDNLSIDLDGLSSGVYMLNYKDNRTSLTRKFIIR